MFHHVAVDDAVLSGGYGKEIQLGLDPFARLFMYERHHCRRICRVLNLCQPALPFASHRYALRQVRDVMGQGVIGVHLHGSVAR